MQGRVYSSGSYRFGFNGKEKEADGTTDNYDFGARIYDGRLGRWLSVDPDGANTTFESQFIFAINAPILFKDYTGRAIIKPATIISISMPENPTCIGQYAQTVAQGSFNFAPETNTWNFIVATEYRFSAKIDEIDALNLGFKEFLTIHEEEHRNRYHQSADLTYEIKTTIFGKEISEAGQLDQIMNNIYSKYVKPKLEENENNMKKDLDELQSKFVDQVKNDNLVNGTEAYKTAYKDYQEKKSAIIDAAKKNADKIRGEQTPIAKELLNKYQDKAEEVQFHRGKGGINNAAATRMSDAAAKIQNGAKVVDETGKNIKDCEDS